MTARVDEAQIDAWAFKHVQNPKDQRRVASYLKKLRNQDQVRECQAYALFLLNGQRSASYILQFLRAAQRLGLQRPEGRLLDVTPAQVRAWANTPRYPTRLPRVGEPWPRETEGSWEEVSHNLRVEHQEILARFFAHMYTLAGMKPDEARSRARAVLMPTEGIQPFPRAVKMPRGDPRPEDWQKALQALEERPFEVEAMRDMWRFVIRVLLCQGNRLPALIRARLSDLKLELEGGQRARIEKGWGPKSKPNPTLRLDDAARAAGAVWAASHPFRHEKDPPLLIMEKAALRGICEETNSLTVSAFLIRLGRRAGLSFSLGARAFRYYGHDEGATAGLSSRELELKFGRTPGSDETRRYVRFTGWRVTELMRRVRGIEDGVERRCPGCRRLLDAEQPACTDAACPQSGAAPQVNNTELLADLGIKLHNHTREKAKA